MILYWRICLYYLYLSCTYLSISKQLIWINIPFQCEKKWDEDLDERFIAGKNKYEWYKKRKYEKISIIFFLIIEMRPLTDHINGNI